MLPLFPITRIHLRGMVRKGVLVFRSGAGRRPLDYLVMW